MTRAQLQSKYTQGSAHGTRSWDYFCLTPIGVRVAYASDVRLETLPSNERTSVRGRVVLVLTANPFYALNGVRPGATLRAAAKTLHTDAGMRVGLNNWYLAPNGSTTAVLKVRHGIVREIGIATKMATRGRKAQLTFIKKRNST